MSKATLIGIATQPRYDDDKGWVGADIMANIEVDITEGAKIGIDRIGLNITLSPKLLDYIKNNGYQGKAEVSIMTRTKACLYAMETKYAGAELTTYSIYEVIRLKMPRFVRKSIERAYYDQNFETGEIHELNPRKKL